VGDLTEGTYRPSTEDLLALVAGSGITARTLEYWRQKAILPKAERTGQDGKRPTWTYPPGTLDQLAALLRLRTKTKNPDLLRSALWFEGFPMEISDVRRSIAAVLREQLRLLTAEVAKHPSSGPGGEAEEWTAIESLGRQVARKRGRQALPRFGRQTSEDRERAAALALGLLLGNPAASERLDVDAHRLERMIGVDQGRRARGAVPAWLSGSPSEGLESFAERCSFPVLIDTIETATDEELEASSTLGRVLFDGMTAFGRIAHAVTGLDNPVGLAGITMFRDDPAVAVWFPAFVIGSCRSPRMSEGLRSIVDALGADVLPLDEQARELAALDGDARLERLRRLGALPFAEQAQIKRLMAEYRDGSTE
jgi:DNA-binding transcriptional MerR regulator